MSQTSVTQYGAVGIKGLISGVGRKETRSYAAEEVIPCGYPVKLGTNKETQVLKATTGASTIGVAIFDHGREQVSGVSQYSVTETVGVLTAGQIWVETDDAVVAGATANLKTANGKFTDEAVTTGIEAFTQISVKFLTATSAAGLALVEIK